MRAGPILGRCTVLMLLSSAACGQTVRSWRSDERSQLQPQPAVAFAAQTKGAPVTIAVDDKERYQTMDGFGASITDGAAWLLQERLTPALEHDVMTQIFDPVKGIGLSFLRQPIGSTDLSRDHYSFDDLAPGQHDPDLAHFSTKHDDAYVFPVIREALQLNPAITVMATPWSPPAWMKTKATMNGGALRDDAMGVYAAYLVHSLQAFQQAGVPVKYMTVQNEPLNETHDYPGTLMLAKQQKELIGNYLGPALAHAKLATKVLAYDHNWDHPEYPIEVLSDPAAAPFLAGSALHCYGGDVAAQTVIHNRFPDEGVWMTECSGGTWQQESPLVATAHLLIGSTRNWAKAVVLWGVALDAEHQPHAGGCGTCRGLVTVDLHATPSTVSYTGDFYGLGHASKFVHPGAVRIGSTMGGGLENVAFQDRDGSIALIVLNHDAREQTFAVTWQGLAFHASAPAGSVSTYVWQPVR